MPPPPRRLLSGTRRLTTKDARQKTTKQPSASVDARRRQCRRGADFDAVESGASAASAPITVVIPTGQNASFVPAQGPPSDRMPAGRGQAGMARVAVAMVRPAGRLADPSASDIPVVVRSRPS